MSVTELNEFLAALDKVQAEHCETPEKARQFLQEEGYLTEEGEIAKPYAS